MGLTSLFIFSLEHAMCVLFSRTASKVFIAQKRNDITFSHLILTFNSYIIRSIMQRRVYALNNWEDLLGVKLQGKNIYLSQETLH